MSHISISFHVCVCVCVHAQLVHSKFMLNRFEMRWNIGEGWESFKFLGCSVEIEQTSKDLKWYKNYLIALEIENFTTNLSSNSPRMQETFYFTRKITSRRKFYGISFYRKLILCYKDNFIRPSIRGYFYSTMSKKRAYRH